MVKISEILNYIKSSDSKQAIVLHLLMNKEFLTSAEIMTIGSTPEFLNVFSVCPHSIIKEIRRKYGYDIIKSESVPYNNKVSVFGKIVKSVGPIYKYYLNREMLFNG